MRSKFGIERISSLVYNIFEKDKVNSSKNKTVLTIRAVNKDKKIKRKFCGQAWSQYFETF